VTPEVLRWARETVGYDLDEAAKRINIKPEKLAGAERGDLLLTLRQAEKAADVYQRSFASLFMKEPPPEDPLEVQMRRLSDAPPLPWPPALRLLVRKIMDRQQNAVELYEILDETPPWRERKKELQADVHVLAPVVRPTIGITFADQISWRDSKGYAGLKTWVDAIEDLGVLVMQDGTLDVEQMRGFAAPHPDVPIIVLNTQDDPRARCFTLLHEFGHLLLHLNEVQPRDPEAWCNGFAGDVLMPDSWIIDYFNRRRRRRLLDQIDELALAFGVTPMAAAVRARQLNLAARRELDQVIAAIKARPPKGPQTGGDHYLNQIARMGPGFIQLVLTALESQTVTYPVASQLLDGMKVNQLDKLRERLVQRTSPA
jgi:Zn-dependent peptidase ImmA (M78 family)/transcriptional regulator with XRE-family HTH domain